VFGGRLLFFDGCAVVVWWLFGDSLEVLWCLFDGSLVPDYFLFACGLVVVW